jgi:hypothetical protein
MGRIHDEQHGVAGLESIVNFLHHAAVELGVGLMDSGGVDKDYLGGGMSRVCLRFLFEGNFEYSVDAGPGGLGFVGDNRELLPEQSIQKSGLARVWATDDGDETGAKCHFLYYALSAAFALRRPDGTGAGQRGLAA